MSEENSSIDPSLAEAFGALVEAFQRPDATERDAGTLAACTAARLPRLVPALVPLVVAELEAQELICSVAKMLDGDREADMPPLRKERRALEVLRETPGAPAGYPRPEETPETALALAFGGIIRSSYVSSPLLAGRYWRESLAVAEKAPALLPPLASLVRARVAGMGERAAQGGLTEPQSRSFDVSRLALQVLSARVG